MSENLADAWLAADPLPGDPLPLLAGWLDEAFAARAQPNPHAVALATVDPDGRPSARMVLCKEIDAETGSLVFYTHRESRKGRALAAHPRAALVFYWGPQHRQARVEGPVEPIGDAESDAYFATRPADAQLGAWASAQSQPVASRAALQAQVDAAAERFGTSLEGAGGLEADARPPIPRPPGWGGYRVHADAVELWVGRPARVHDRALWTRKVELAAGRVSRGSWQATRLQP